MSRLSYLFSKYKANFISDDEKKELLTALIDPLNAEEVNTLFLEEWEAFESERIVFSENEGERILRNIIHPNGENSARHRLTRNLKIVYRIAAALLLLLSANYYFIKLPSKQSSSLTAQHSAVRKLPLKFNRASDKALLTLADGRTIDLEALSTGTIAAVSGLSVVKTSDGQLVYSLGKANSNTGNKAAPKAPQYHVISTPPGGQYQIILADGTKVWLNTSSSLRFPTYFSDDERSVELTGEAYFEVAKHEVNTRKQPFKVISRTVTGRNQELTVLGTHFNVQAYRDDFSVKTTLMEGSVRIKDLNSNSVLTLSPGEQSALTADGTTRAEVNIDEVVAWKQGRFVFNNKPLIEILKQLERWYDLDIDYAQVPHTRYQAFISRDVPLAEVINMLELTGNIKFQIDTIQQTGRVRLRIVK